MGCQSVLGLLCARQTAYRCTICPASVWESCYLLPTVLFPHLYPHLSVQAHCIYNTSKHTCLPAYMTLAHSYFHTCSTLTHTYILVCSHIHLRMHAYTRVLAHICHYAYLFTHTHTPSCILTYWYPHRHTCLSTHSTHTCYRALRLVPQSHIHLFIHRCRQIACVHPFFLACLLSHPSSHAQAYSHPCPCLPTSSHAYSFCSHPPMYTRSPVHTSHSPAHTFVHSLIPMHLGAHTHLCRLSHCLHPFTHTCSPTHTHLCTHLLTHTLAYSFILTHVLAQTHTPLPAHTHPFTLTCARTHLHTHAQTHLCTHSCSQPPHVHL